MAADSSRSPKTSIASALVRWQKRHGRHDLPWQHQADPYRVWLSEVMLQQTQVATVLDYYPRFLQRFPDVHSLAAAPLDEVLAAWSGLGYYSRARNLHTCARQVVAHHGGEFPRSSAELAELPGIGRSTAAAIAVFCFGERAAILDGNVKRVLARVLGFDGDLARAGPQRELWAQAQALLPRHDVPAYTQGLMDLGATLCSVREPRCTACPLRRGCVAQVQGTVASYPAKSRRAQRSRRSNALLLLQHRGRVWLVQRPPRGVWASLWSLPEFNSAAVLRDLLCSWPGEGSLLPSIKHALTHFDWHLQPVHWRLPARLDAAAWRVIEGTLPAGRWLPLNQALQSGLPAPVRRWLEQAMTIARA